VDCPQCGTPCNILRVDYDYKPWACPECLWEEGDPVVKEPGVVMRDLFARDPDAVAALLNHRVPCNEALAEYEYVFVDNDRVGVLGLLNGVLEGLCLPRVAARYDEDGKLVGFQE
jgi:hypothetical protein